ncbi:hypothetical protein, partial [Bacillus velezensis]|uniref:hypothetical protein n=1 Tax=Bacillus velezensis TaxID=492670 RepID=UPI0016438B68
EGLLEVRSVVRGKSFALVFEDLDEMGEIILGLGTLIGNVLDERKKRVVMKRVGWGVNLFDKTLLLGRMVVVEDFLKGGVCMGKGCGGEKKVAWR